MNLELVDVVGRLAAAMLLGALVGFEREARNRTAGLRTHALVALGAALFTLTGAYGFSDLGRGTIDPSRVAGQVAAGVGFIGAGAVLRIGANIKGLTTAATVWLAAALGVATGAGGVVAAAVTTGLALVTLVLFRLLEPIAQRFSTEEHVVRIRYERGHGTLGPLLRSLDQAGLDVVDLDVADDDPEAVAEGVREVTVRLRSPRGTDIARSLGDLEQRPEVRDVETSAAEGDDESWDPPGPVRFP